MGHYARTSCGTAATRLFGHVLCVLRALKRTQNTQNVYYSFRSPSAICLYEDMLPRLEKPEHSVVSSCV